ncbi:hypothetical protein evm_000968 [Chilo suppressalis]|nr:hypothetical protein evm_000968 [Chilo suppressalis]
MSKLFFLVVIAALALGINADAAAVAGTGFPGFPGFSNFAVFPSLPAFEMPEFPKIKMLTPDDIKKMSVGKDGYTHVVGAAVSSESSSRTVNGVPVEKTSKQRVVTNHNGVVTDESYED